MITLDFETEAIEGNPLFSPPKPVGLAVRWESSVCDYVTDPGQMELAWQELMESDKDRHGTEDGTC